MLQRGIRQHFKRLCVCVSDPAIPKNTEPYAHYLIRTISPSTPLCSPRRRSSSITNDSPLPTCNARCSRRCIRIANGGFSPYRTSNSGPLTSATHSIARTGTSMTVIRGRPYQNCSKHMFAACRGRWERHFLSRIPLSLCKVSGQ